jgi:hypothetical protein
MNASGIDAANDLVESTTDLRGAAPEINLPELYHEAKRALAELHSIDEVLDIQNKAIAVQVYAKQAQDREMVERATEIRLRAEIRAGELLLELEERGEREGRGGDRRSKSRAGTLKTTLEGLGVTRRQSSKWQKIAALPEPEQEQMIEAAKQRAAGIKLSQKSRSLTIAPSSSADSSRQSSSPKACVRSWMISAPTKRSIR